MNIHQVNVSYAGEQDRLLLRGDPTALPGMAWVEGKDGLRRAA